MQIKKFQAVLKNKGIDTALILSKDTNFRYFNGFNDFNGVLAISPDNAFIATSILDIDVARAKSRIKRFHAIKKNFFEELKKKIRRKTIGINKDDMTVNQYNNLKKHFNGSRFLDISNELNDIRASKTEEEIKTIKKACKISESILNRLAHELNSKKSEEDIADFIKNEIKKKYCEEAFSTIVATGKNSAKIHHVPTKKKLNGFTVVDFGLKYKDYCTDITRTFYIGNPNKKDVHDYMRVFGLFEGINTVDDIKNIKPLKSQYHASGHSIGLEVHEKPTVSNNKVNIGNNYVLAIELGSYGKRHGIRIENMLLIKNNKLINLIKYPKNLRILRK